jgi:NAD(P) transhydrogenase subunit beta
VLSALIGSVSFAGSMIAFGKLQDLISGRPITYPGQKVGNLALLAALVGSESRSSRASRTSGSSSC